MTVHRTAALLALLCTLVVPATVSAHGPQRGDVLTLERLGDLDGDGVADIAVLANPPGTATQANAPRVWIVLLHADGTPKHHQLYQGTLEDLRINPPAIDPGTARNRERPASATITKTAEPPLGFAPKGELLPDGPPVVRCRDAAVSLDFYGEIEITPDLVDDGSFDAEGPITLTVTPASFTCADVGPNPVTLEVTDTAGQVSICEATVTVIDDEPPYVLDQYRWFHLDESGLATLSFSQVSGYFEACGAVSATLNQYTFDVCEEGAGGRTEVREIALEATVVDVNGNVGVRPIWVYFYWDIRPFFASPSSQSVEYGDLIAPVDVRNNDDPCGSVGLRFFSEPPGIHAGTADLVKLDKRIWVLSGQMLIPPVAYAVDVGGTDSDGYGFGVNVNITVLPEHAAVTFSPENPSAIHVPEGETASFSLDLEVTEAEAAAPGERDRAGDISLANAAVTLVSLDGGPSISGASTLHDLIPGTPDPESSYDYDRLPVTAAFEDVPPGVYLVRADVTGDYYRNAAAETATGTDILTVTDGTSEDFITGGGHFTWPGTATTATTATATDDGDESYPGDRTYFSFKAGFPGAAPDTDKGHLKITRHLKNGGVIRLESDDLNGPLVGAETAVGRSGSFSGRAPLRTEGGIPAIIPFALHVTDGGDKNPDRIWIATGHPDLSMADLAADELPAPDPIVVTRGNITVHGKGGTSNRPGNTGAEPTDTGIFPRVIAPTLFQNAPNPFTRSTRIAFQIAEAAHVRFSVFDVRGREAARLVDRHLTPGWHETSLAADTLPSGVYFYRIQAGSFTETRRMILLR